MRRIVTTVKPRAGARSGSSRPGTSKLDVLAPCPSRPPNQGGTAASIAGALARRGSRYREAIGHETEPETGGQLSVFGPSARKTRPRRSYFRRSRIRAARECSRARCSAPLSGKIDWSIFGRRSSLGREVAAPADRRGNARDEDTAAGITLTSDAPFGGNEDRRPPAPRERLSNVIEAIFADQLTQLTNQARPTRSRRKTGNVPEGRTGRRVFRALEVGPPPGSIHQA